MMMRIKSYNNSFRSIQISSNVESLTKTTELLLQNCYSQLKDQGVVSCKGEIASALINNMIIMVCLTNPSKHIIMPILHLAITFEFHIKQVYSMYKMGMFNLLKYWRLVLSSNEITDRSGRYRRNAKSSSKSVTVGATFKNESGTP